LVIVVVLGPLVLVGFMIFQDAVNFATTYDPAKLNETVQTFLNEFGAEEAAAGPQVNDTDNSTLDNITNAARPGQLANVIGNGAKQFAERLGAELLEIVPGLLIGLVITGFVIYYGFAEGELFYAKFRHALPLPDEIEDSLFREIARVTQVVFVGNILVSVLGFFVFGVPNAIFWGFIMIILGILPLVGAPLIWGPAALWLFIDGHSGAALGLLIVNGGIVIGYVDNILRPKLIGKAANVHPVAILIGVLGGVEAFGALGFVIGPLVLAIFIALVRAYIEWHPRWRERRERGTERFSPAAQIDIVASSDRTPPAPPTPPSTGGP
jgi:predicted PurR-regulated permease PerM